MVALKRNLFISFLILLVVSISAAITGWWLDLLKFVFNNYIYIFKIYLVVVILIGCYYFYVHKEKGGIGLLGTTILDCAAIIATFYTGISYFHEFFLSFSDFLILLSEKYLPFVMANSVLLYWSLNQIIYKFRMTFYERASTAEIKESISPL